MVRYTVEDVESQIAAFTSLGQLLAIDAVPSGHRPEADVHGPQRGHEEAVLVDALGVELDESVEGGPALGVDGFVPGVYAMQEALKSGLISLSEQVADAIFHSPPIYTIQIPDIPIQFADA